MKKQLTTWKGIQKGTKFIVTNNSNSHNYPIGEILVLNQDGINSTSMSSCVDHPRGSTYNSLTVKDIELVPMGIEDIRAELAEKRRENDRVIKELESLDTICERYGLKEYNPNIMLACRIVDTASNVTLSSNERVHRVLELMKEL